MNKIIYYSSVLLMVAFLLSCEEKTPPVLSTNEVSGITTTSAFSGGVIKNDGGSPIIANGICWNTTGEPTVEDNKTTENGGSWSFTGDLDNLSPKTLYYVRAYATNNEGTGYGETISFTTLGDVPEVSVTGTTNIALDSARINGIVNPNSLSTDIFLEWGTTTGYGNTVPLNSQVTGGTNVIVSVKLTNLTPGTTYHYRIKSENSLGITYSSDMTFKTLGDVPNVLVEYGTNLQPYSVTLSGLVNPNYLSTSAILEWGASTSYGNIIQALQNPVTGNFYINVSVNLSGLTPRTTYHYRISATNILGTKVSNDMTFKTLGDVPIVTIQNAKDLQYTTATLKGSVNPNYLSSTVSFEWGPTINYGNHVTASESPVSGGTIVSVSAAISGLTQGTTYHYRICATNELGTACSEDKIFTTLAPITDVDGNLYNIKTIGNQVWMTENLKTTKYADGTPISSGLYYPSDNISNVAKYGYLYDWAAAIKQPPVYNTIMLDLQGQRVQGACPTNWHLPTEGEWVELINLYGGKETAGLKLKIANPGYWLEPLNIQQPLSGFNAIPAGMRHTDGWYNSAGNDATYWTTSQWYMGGSIMGRNVSMIYHNPDVTINYTNSNNQPGSYGLSIRCIKD